jgi:hypothetical protein
MCAPKITMWMRLSSSSQASKINKEIEDMIENFITAFIVYFVVIDNRVNHHEINDKGSDKIFNHILYLLICCAGLSAGWQAQSHGDFWGAHLTGKNSEKTMLLIWKRKAWCCKKETKLEWWQDQVKAAANGLWFRARERLLPLVKDFSWKARYPLDLGAAKPVILPTKCNQSDRPDLGMVPDKAAVSGKTCKSGRASNGGVAQLVRAAES